MHTFKFLLNVTKISTNIHLALAVKVNGELALNAKKTPLQISPLYLPVLKRYYGHIPLTNSPFKILTPSSTKNNEVWRIEQHGSEIHIEIPFVVGKHLEQLQLKTNTSYNIRIPVEEWHQELIKAEKMLNTQISKFSDKGRLLLWQVDEPISDINDLNSHVFQCLEDLVLYDEKLRAHSVAAPSYLSKSYLGKVQSSSDKYPYRNKNLCEI